MIVEGKKTKLGMGNDLFNNAKDIKRIICPAQNAYEKLNEMEQFSEKKYLKIRL